MAFLGLKLKQTTTGSKVAQYLDPGNIRQLQIIIVIHIFLFRLTMVLLGHEPVIHQQELGHLYLCLKRVNI